MDQPADRQPSSRAHGADAPDEFSVGRCLGLDRHAFPFSFSLDGLWHTGLAFYITRLIKVDAGNSFVLTVVMTVVSLCLYPLVNKLAPKFGKKILVIIGFFVVSGEEIVGEI